jgi:hypothetical protein
MNTNDTLNKPITFDLLAQYWREVLLGVLFLCAGGALFYTFIVSGRVANEEIKNAQLQEDVSRLKIEVETLIATSAENTKVEIERRLAAEQEKIASLQNSLSTESQKRIALENKIATDAGISSKRLGELENSFSKNYDLATIIGEWRKRTAHVTCSFGILGSSRGSGVLTLLSAGTDGYKYGVLTNQHVVMYGNRTAERCTVTFPDNAFTFTAFRNAGEIELSTQGQDFARLLISSTNPFITANAAGVNELCSTAPAVGDELVILGYPSIGSGTDITATDGIVSGTEGDYFITSAKVEQGNSGGSAVLLKNNCLLGIPTFVQLGNLEALARILDIRSVFNK